jgi:hypothetical protein
MTRHVYDPNGAYDEGFRACQEQAIALAKAHKTEKNWRWSHGMSQEQRDEISAEERGEKIAAQILARKIGELKP